MKRWLEKTYSGCVDAKNPVAMMCRVGGWTKGYVRQLMELKVKQMSVTPPVRGWPLTMARRAKMTLTPGTKQGNHIRDVSRFCCSILIGKIALTSPV